MLTFSSQQMAAFGALAQDDYVEGLKGRVAERVPHLARTLDADRLDALVRAAMAGAATQGFTLRGPVRLFLDLCIGFGSGFVDDPLYPWAAEAIGDRDPLDQMARAETLYWRARAANAEIHGPDEGHTRRALAALQAWAKREHDFAGLDLEDNAVADMQALHPQKAAHGGEAALRRLFRKAQAACGAHGVTEARPVTLTTALMFAFGAGCLSDPIYAWMGATLSDPGIATAGKRFERLERKSITWLDAVVARQQAEG